MQLLNPPPLPPSLDRVNCTEVLEQANGFFKSNKLHMRALPNLDQFDFLSNTTLASVASLEGAYCPYNLGRLREELEAAEEIRQS